MEPPGLGACSRVLGSPSGKDETEIPRWWFHREPPLRKIIHAPSARDSRFARYRGVVRLF